MNKKSSNMENNKEQININNMENAKNNDIKTKKSTGVDSDSVLYEVITLLLKIACVAAVFVLIFSFIFGLFRYSGIDMKPAISDGDLVLTYRLDKNYQLNDLCAYTYGDEFTASRVVALEGDEVNIDSQGLVVNGNHLQENNITKSTLMVEGGVDFPLRVGDGQVFVLGDNREIATDSRIFGCVDVTRTQGKVIGLFRHRGF